MLVLIIGLFRGQILLLINMKQEYKDYIESWGAETGESLENNCINVAVQMHSNFPELEICIGYITTAIDAEHNGDELSLVTSHCWLENKGHEIIDPSLYNHNSMSLYLKWDKKDPYLIPDWVGMIPLDMFKRLYTKFTSKEPIFVKVIDFKEGVIEK